MESESLDNMVFIEHKNNKAKKIGVSYRFRSDIFSHLKVLSKRYNFSDTALLELLITYAMNCEDSKLDELILQARIDELDKAKDKLTKQLSSNRKQYAKSKE